MSAYTKPIIRFGLITPAVFNGILLAGALLGVSKLSDIREKKELRYKEQTMRVNAMKTLEADLAPKRPAFEDQKKLLLGDPGQILTRILESLQPKYKEIELERSSLVFPLDRGRIGRHVRTDLARVKSSFQGGFGPMQEALFQVEALMPQAVLEDLKISRKADLLLDRPDHLVMEITHTCWKAVETK
jgi:hypothetical protein